jgi:hypothetical protein
MLKRAYRIASEFALNRPRAETGSGSLQVLKSTRQNVFKEKEGAFQLYETRRHLIRNDGR